MRLLAMLSCFAHRLQHTKQDPEKRPIFRPENLAKSENLSGPWAL